MDICLQIVITPNNHTLTPDKDAARQQRGDIIGGFLATDIGTLQGNDYIPNEPLGITPNLLGFVFIKDVPNIAIRRIRDRLTESHDDLTDPEKPVTLLRRKWGLRASDIPAGVRNKLLNDRYITFTWTQVKNYLRNKATDTLIADADL